MTVKEKHKAIKRPTKTINPAWCCSGVLITGGLSKALVFDIRFRNCATTTTPHYYRYKKGVSQKVTPSHYALGLYGFAASSVAFAMVAASVGCNAGSSNHSRQ